MNGKSVRCICEGCVYALWATTAAGKRHPNGNGRCMYEIKLPVLPAAFHTLNRVWNPRGLICGGYIQRATKHSEAYPTEPCVYRSEI